MSKTYAELGLILILLIMGAGCAIPNISEQSKFVGEWETPLGVIYTFYANGTYKGMVTEGEYTVEKGILICEGRGQWDGYTTTYNYTFLEGGKILRLAGKQNYTLTRRSDK